MLIVISVWETPGVFLVFITVLHTVSSRWTENVSATILIEYWRQKLKKKKNQNIHWFSLHDWQRLLVFSDSKLHIFGFWSVGGKNSLPVNLQNNQRMNQWWKQSLLEDLHSLTECNNTSSYLWIKSSLEDLMFHWLFEEPQFTKEGYIVFYIR